MEQRLFPVVTLSYRIQIIQTNQLALLQVIQQRRTVLDHLGQWQIHRRLATLLETQTGRLQQMAAAHTGTAPEIDQTFRPPRIRFAQTLDITKRRSVGSGVVVGEGGVIA